MILEWNTRVRISPNRKELTFYVDFYLKRNLLLELKDIVTPLCSILFVILQTILFLYVFPKSSQVDLEVVFATSDFIASTWRSQDFNFRRKTLVSFMLRQ